MLSKTDRAYSTAGETGAPPQAEEVETPAAKEPCKTKEEWVHGKVFAYDDERISKEKGLKAALERHLTGPGGWLPHPVDELDELDTAKLSLSDLVSGHHQKKRKEYTLRLLKQADGDDSGEDQYNAVGINQPHPVQAATVFGREEKLAPKGLKTLDDLRLSLYPLLAEILAEPGAPAAKRGELWKLLRKAMRHGLGKTQRAANDVQLHQHAWGVAARLKAFLLRDLLDRPSKKQDGTYEIRNNFRLLTIRWDAWATITPFAHLSDVVGREVMLARLRESLRHAVEEEYALGNRVYEDDDGVHFLVADLPWDLELTGLVRGIANQVTGGEVQPVVRLSESTERVTDLVALMEEARREVPLVGDPAWVQAWAGSPSGEVCPVCQKRPLAGERDLCEWCERRRGEGIRERLAQEGTVWTGEIAGEAGRVALLVARFDLERWLDGTMLHTLFITSPQDIPKGYPLWQARESENRCLKYLTDALQEREIYEMSWAGLCQALSQLTDGQQEKEQWTEHLRTFADKRKDLRELEDKRQRWSDEIASPDTHLGKKAHLGELLKDLESQIPQLKGELRSLEATLLASPTPEAVAYHHLAGKGQKEQVEATAKQLQKPYDLTPEQAILLTLARKNPSASRLLRVWQTTRDFLKQQARGLGGMVEGQKRVVFTLQGKPHPGIYETELPALGPTEVFVRPGGKAQTITRLSDEDVRRLRQTRRLRLETGEKGRKVTGVEVETYRPFQVITASPNLLLAMLPADAVVETANRMRQAYVKEFGKVQGRLPFHVGLVFMDAHYPMFAALDTARRLAETFDRLAETPIEATLTAPVGQDAILPYTLRLRSDRFGACTWRVPARRGDGETDWYHPYFLVREGKGLDERGMSLAGPGGRWVHVSQLRAGDRLALWPNFFDFIFLDTVSRRFDVQANPLPSCDPCYDEDTASRRSGAQLRRPHPLLGPRHSPRPYLLDGVVRLQKVWEAIRAVPGMSETRLEAATSLLAHKWKAWQLAGAGSPHCEAWESYRWLAKQVVARDFGGSATIEEAILDGVFFDVVELYRHVLKTRISGQQRI